MQIVKAYQVWVEKSMYGKKYMGDRTFDVPHRSDQKIKVDLEESEIDWARCQLLQVLDS